MWRHRGVLWTVGICAIAAATLVFGRTHWSQIVQSVRGVGAVDPKLICAGVACSLLAVLNRGALNHAAHRAVGAETGLAAITRTAAVGFAAQKMVKPAAAVGLAVFVAHGRRRGHSAAIVAGACAVVALASFAAMGVVLALTVAVLGVSGRLTGWWVAAAVGFGVYATVITTIAVASCRGGRVTVWLGRIGNRLARRGRRGGETAEGDPTSGFVEAIRHARNHPAELWRMAAHATLSKVLGAGMLLVAAVAVGLPVGPVDAFVIYATALAASTISIVPGGFGVVEATTGALFVAAGASAGEAILAVALFRLFDLWLPVLIGATAANVGVRGSRVARGIACEETTRPLSGFPVLAPLPPLVSAPAS
jgi:uncharacterized membrane protein YbhN (UPF0104 family)